MLLYEVCWSADGFGKGRPVNRLRPSLQLVNKVESEADTVFDSRVCGDDDRAHESQPFLCAIRRSDDRG